MTARFPLLAALFLMGNGSYAAPAIPQAEPTIDTAAIIMMAPDGYAGTCFDSSKFRVARPDTLFPARFSGGRRSGLVKLTAEDRTAYLQRYSAMDSV